MAQSITAQESERSQGQVQTNQKQQSSSILDNNVHRNSIQLCADKKK